MNIGLFNLPSHPFLSKCWFMTDCIYTCMLVLVLVVQCFPFDRIRVKSLNLIR